MAKLLLFFTFVAEIIGILLFLFVTLGQYGRIMNEVHVRVPATTANLGPGFDCLGIALQLYNTTTVWRVDAGDSDEMAREAGNAFFRVADVKPFAFGWKTEGGVPRSRGLGSSVTVRLGILHGLNELSGRPLDKHSLFRICSDLEGHPDNAAPAAYGGFAVAPASGPVQCYAVDKSLAFVLLVPSCEILTSEARRVLPRAVPFGDAVVSAGNAAAIAAAFASGNYRKLAGCFDDRLHEPYRERLMPWIPSVVAAARESGALGGWLSGSGSCVACATLVRPEKIANAMLVASGLDECLAAVVRADNSGVRILKKRE